jgi:hypothetical protein
MGINKFETLWIGSLIMSLGKMMLEIMGGRKILAETAGYAQSNIDSRKFDNLSAIE